MGNRKFDEIRKTVYNTVKICRLGLICVSLGLVTIDLNRPEFSIIEHEIGERYSTVVAQFASKKNQITCPRCHSNNIRRNGIEGDGITKWDVVRGNPAKVTIRAQLWKCNKCGNKFRDPQSPYAGKGRTTAAFDKWAGQTLSEHPDSYQKEIADIYGLPASVINSALHDHLDSVRKCIKIAVPVETIWLIPVKYKKKKIIAVFGQDIVDKDYCFSMRIDPGAIVFFGISSEYSLQGVIDATRLLIRDHLKTIYCPDDLVSEDMLKTYIIRDLPEGPYPEQVQKLLDIIDVFKKRRFSPDRLELMLMHQDPARREELQRRGELPFNTLCLGALYAYNHSYTLFDLEEWSNFDVWFYSIDIDSLDDLYSWLF